MKLRSAAAYRDQSSGAGCRFSALVRQACLSERPAEAEIPDFAVLFITLRIR
jgi:hypothetical protein